MDTWLDGGFYSEELFGLGPHQAGEASFSEYSASGGQRSLKYPLDLSPNHPNQG